jgi:hypothetical protein
VSQVLVAHAYNPNYSGSRDQEVLSLRPAQEIVPETLSQKKKKNLTQKRAGRVTKAVRALA